jgi:hypothetical protein
MKSGGQCSVIAATKPVACGNDGAFPSKNKYTNLACFTLETIRFFARGTRAGEYFYHGGLEDCV